MFTGIIETTAIVKNIIKDKSNIIFTLNTVLAQELKVDQSVSHNGVCLTVTKILQNAYQVTAIEETLQKTSLGNWKIGSIINLERCMHANGRLDGHIVQGHVDTIGKCMNIEDKNGSWLISISYQNDAYFTVEKGSICLNGISLTVVESFEKGFSVAIIPYTFENTNLKQLHVGEFVNLEFDIIGKYIAKIAARSALGLH